MSSIASRNTPDWPGHALIDIYPHIRKGCDEIVLIADPLHFPPDLTERMTLAIRELLKSLVEPHWNSLEEDEFEAAVLSVPGSDLPDSRPVQNSTGWQPAMRPRILVSLIMRSGVTQAELAFVNVHPLNFLVDEIDWFVERLNDILNEWPNLSGPGFLNGQN